MAKWDELKDWIEKGAFYHGNETPKWIVGKILNKIENIEKFDNQKADNLIGRIDSDSVGVESDKLSNVVSLLNNLTIRVGEIENQDKRLPYDVLDLKDRIREIEIRLGDISIICEKVDKRCNLIENSENWNELMKLMNDSSEMKEKIDLLSEDKVKDPAFIISHDEKKVIDEKLAAITRYVDTRFAEVKEYVSNRIYNSESKYDQVIATEIRELDTRISRFIDNHLQNHFEDEFPNDFEDETIDSYESMWHELRGWLVTTANVPTHWSTIVIGQMKRFEEYENKEKS